MQTIGQPPAPPSSDDRRILGPLGILAVVLAAAAAALVIARGDSLPTDRERWTPLQTAEVFNEHYEAGEVAAFQSLLRSDAVLCLNQTCSENVPFDTDIYNAPFMTAHESQYLAATGGTLGAECVADGPHVECMWHQSNLLYEAGGLEPSIDRQAFRVETGWITEYTPGYRFSGIMHDDRVQQNQYSSWVQVVHPHEHETLFEGQLMLVFSEASRDRHQVLIREWMSDRRS